MDLVAAAALARRLLEQYRLADWRFAFDHSRRRFGVCHWHRKTISLSRHLTKLNEEPQVTDTILHEIAHGLAGRRAGHGPVWKSMAMAIGARPRRCFADHEVVVPALRYISKCGVCGLSRQVARRSPGKRSCGRCSRVFDPRFILRLEPNPAYSSR